MTFKKPTAVPRKTLSKGLSTLSGLWKNGFFPDDLERHYFLHWFVVHDGNIIQTAKALQIHRNTIQGHFLHLGYSKKSVRLRHAWQLLNEKYPDDPFGKKFHRFYLKAARKPVLSAEENAGLTALWQVKFPFKTLVPHYLLWAIRAGRSKGWVQKELGYSYRHRARLLSHLLKANSRDGFWLAPLKPQLSEIYSPRYRAVLSGKKQP